jgi:hypothetical protein
MVSYSTYEHALKSCSELRTSEALSWRTASDGGPYKSSPTSKGNTSESQLRLRLRGLRGRILLVTL